MNETEKKNETAVKAETVGAETVGTVEKVTEKEGTVENVETVGTVEKAETVGTNASTDTADDACNATAEPACNAEPAIITRVSAKPVNLVNDPTVPLTYIGDGLATLYKDWSLKTWLFECNLKAGFETDGASVPELLWKLAGKPFATPRVKAALVHDWLYASHRLPKTLCDICFLVAMWSVGYAWWRSVVDFWCVYRFGGSAYYECGRSADVALTQGSFKWRGLGGLFGKALGGILKLGTWLLLPLCLAGCKSLGEADWSGYWDKISDWSGYWDKISDWSGYWDKIIDLFK